MTKANVDIAVLCIFFNRPKQFRQVFEQVKKARPSKLFLYQDGPRDETDIANILLCRKIAEDIDWDCEVQKFYQKKNLGVNPSEYIAIKWMFCHVTKAIILEDDDVPTVSFLGSARNYLTNSKMTHELL